MAKTYDTITEWPNPICEQYDIETPAGNTNLLGTRVILEIPEHQATGIGFDQYWNTTNTMNKMKVNNDYSLEFKTRHAFIDDSLEVYIDGELDQEENYIEDKDGENRIIELNESARGKYFYVSYITKNVIWTGPLDNVLSEPMIPTIGHKLIIKCRKVVNKIETVMELVPTRWIGLCNTLKGDYYNIIPEYTHIIYPHLTEIHQAIIRLLNYIREDSLVEDIIFSDICKDDNFDISYIHEIIYALNRIETFLYTYGAP